MSVRGFDLGRQHRHTRYQTEEHTILQLLRHIYPEMGSVLCIMHDSTSGHIDHHETALALSSTRRV